MPQRGVVVQNAVTHSFDAHAYEIDGRVVQAEEFTAVACDPFRSVVVEACAGSGKTWLLVARMLRLLLAGAKPAELLAITFTKKAAQEMRERLIELLSDLALKPADEVRQLLIERGVDRAEVERLMPAARGLYQSVLSSPSGLSIDTFHSWFMRLIQIAPLASGIPHGQALVESTEEVRKTAYRRLMQAINADEGASIKGALTHLYEVFGNTTTQNLLDDFLDKRAEWWATQQAGEQAALEGLEELVGEDAEHDARLSLWDDAQLLARYALAARLLGAGSKVNQTRAMALETALTNGPSLPAFDALCVEFFGKSGNGKRTQNRVTKDLTAALDKHYGANGVDLFEEEWEQLAEFLQTLRKRSFDRQVIAVNASLFEAGSAYLAHYQSVKLEQRVFDFADMEWHAYRLMRDPEHAAYLQSRLDARYRHILLDEFQDTNPLQWSIVRNWLDAYGDDAAQPSVFIVGDPKQSIYRFRRAEPRVFAAARDMLAAQGAAVLRTSQTRRNAQAIVYALNASFTGNPIFHPQTTLSEVVGEVWRLPLAEKVGEVEEGQNGRERDPLTQPKLEQEDQRRYEEGRALAPVLYHATQQLAAQEQRPRRWADVMLLVKKRRYIGAYERALREAGIPLVSDRRGGLLASLEVDDLVALLRFLVTPSENVALAQVLKSPLFGATDADLITLAKRNEANWWLRLRAHVGEMNCVALVISGDLVEQADALEEFAKTGAMPGATASANDEQNVFVRAVRLLSRWIEVAPYLPVHDLLDRVLHEGEVVRRVAQCAHPTQRAQVLGNIDAFMALALELDAGRYPSLPRFIEQIRQLREGQAKDAPNEADIDAASDAVKILTIHSAKGLEAPIVVVLDANHSDPRREDGGILCDWPQDAEYPTHFSAFGKASERGYAREALFAAEQEFTQQEDWNLLYVAVTRARAMLFMSGVIETRAEDGVNDASWYGRMRALSLYEVTEFVLEGELPEANAQFEWNLFEPEAMPALMPLVPSVTDAALVDEGVALHGLLERVTQSGHWPVQIPAVQEVARWVGCGLNLAQIVIERAERILNTPELQSYFDPRHFVRAFNELEIVAEDKVLRIDRLVEGKEVVWVLDYKRDLLDSERSAYAAQLQRYRMALAPLFPTHHVRSVVITPDGVAHEFA